jgi:hypothetical protein
MDRPQQLPFSPKGIRFSPVADAEYEGRGQIARNMARGCDACVFTSMHNITPIIPAFCLLYFGRPAAACVTATDNVTISGH